MQANEVALSGELIALEPLRYTPAGVPVVGFRLLHRSRQVEAGVGRQVECDISGVALGEAALALSGLRIGNAVKVSGFLNRRNRTSAQLVLHANGIELSEETQHGDVETRQGQGQGQG